MVDREPEIWQGEMFVALMGLKLSEPLVRGQPPEPDVVFTISEGLRIGVEITQIQPGGVVAQAHEGELTALLEGARRLHVESARPPVLVGVNWSAGYEPTKRQRLNAVAALCMTVHESMPNAGRIEINVEDNPSPVLPEGIDALTIERLPTEPTHFFTRRSTWVGPPESSHLDAGISRKNAKIANYKDAYGERWLVLTLGGGSPATWGSVRSNLPRPTVRSFFDRTFVLCIQEMAVVEISSNRGS